MKEQMNNSNKQEGIIFIYLVGKNFKRQTVFRNNKVIGKITLSYISDKNVNWYNLSESQFNNLYQVFKCIYALIEQSLFLKFTLNHQPDSTKNVY